MSDIAAAMALLQFGDSFFPSGSVSFSWGLEGLTEKGAVTSAESVHSFVIGQLHARWALFDRPVIVAAHRAMMDLEAVAAIDHQVEIQTPSAELRAGSRRMGEVLLSVFGRLETNASTPYRGLIKSGAAYGHVVPMQGLLWGRAGLSEPDVVALSAHTFCSGLLGAALRLGSFTHIDAQLAIFAMRKEAARIAALPVPAVTELSSYGIEAEIAVMQHANNRMRVFAN